MTQTRVTTIQGGVGSPVLGRRQGFGREPVRARDSEKCLDRDSLSEAGEGHLLGSRRDADRWRHCGIGQGLAGEGTRQRRHGVRTQEADETGSPSSESDLRG